MAFFDRILTETRNAARRLGITGGTISPTAVASSQLSRLTDYDLRDKLLEGSAFLPSAQGGALKTILQSLGKPSEESKNPVIAYHNPIPGIVGLYQETLAGSFGKEITLADEPKVIPATADALDRLWRWSNLDTAKVDLCQWAANQGTCGIRVVYQPGETADDSRIYLQFDHPRDIADVDVDSRGNVTAVLIKRIAWYSPALGEPEVPVEVREEIRKDGFSLRYAGAEQLSPDEQDNPLGVCPYVLLRHDHRPGDTFGRHAYAGSERAIFGINWMLSQLDEATARALSETIFMSGGGPKPQRFPLGRVTVLYAQTMQGVPAPGYDSITPRLDFAGVIAAVERDAGYLRERQPELILNALTLLSGLSGETIGQVIKPAETAVLRARALYEDALIRALQIGLSYGVLYGLWNLGTGVGTAEAAQRAYDDGQGPEAFAFAERPALPQTPLGQTQQATAGQADAQAKATTAKALDGIVDRKYQLETVLGIDAKEAARIMAEQDKERAAADAALTAGPPTDGTPEQPATVGVRQRVKRDGNGQISEIVKRPIRRRGA